MMARGHKDSAAWSVFWEQNARRGGGGCLPTRWDGIEKPQKSAWARFAATIARDSHVLDLATGDARVPRWIAAERSDLAMTGVDLAPKLPPAPAGVRVLPSIAMEDLPFDDGSFGAVTSQFGFEYGDTAAIAAEIAHVLDKQGVVGLMVHRSDGPILEHNRIRRGQLDWILEDRAVVTKVRAALNEPDGVAKAMPIAAELAREGEAKYGQSSPAWEIPEAVRRTLVLGARFGTQSILDTLKAIESQAENEIGRMESLARACAVADGREAIIAQFAALGIEYSGCEAVAEPSGRPFANMLTFTAQ